MFVPSMLGTYSLKGESVRPAPMAPTQEDRDNGLNGSPSLDFFHPQL